MKWHVHEYSQIPDSSFQPESFPLLVSEQLYTLVLNVVRKSSLKDCVQYYFSIRTVIKAQLSTKASSNASSDNQHHLLWQNQCSTSSISLNVIISIVRIITVRICPINNGSTQAWGYTEDCSKAPNSGLFLLIPGSLQTPWRLQIVA